MILRAFDALPPVLFARATVVSSYPGILSLAGRRGYLPVSNPVPEEGQSASIRLGLSELLDMDGVLFAVCDQPWLERRSVECLLEQFSLSPDCICAMSWQGKRGNPVIFPEVLFPELLALDGDWGGGSIIPSHLLRLVEAETAQELQDIDTPIDLEWNQKSDNVAPKPSKTVRFPRAFDCLYTSIFRIKKEIINRADVGGKYQGTWQTGQASWVTVVHKLTPNPTLPKTGY